jgi:hypothetical protein
MTALIPFVHRPLSGLNLGFVFDNVEHPFAWGIATQLDAAIIWFFILIGIAAEPVFGLARRRAVGVAVTFGVLSVLVLGLLGGKGQTANVVSPYEGWQTTQVGGIILHASPDAPKETLAVISLVCGRAEARVTLLTGLKLGPKDPRGTSGPGLGRIDCYVYPSVEEKVAVTGNASVAQRVEWANAIHLAWGDGSESALTRELLKLMDARAFGKVYTPLVRDGLAVCAGRTWGGQPVRKAGRELLEDGLLPGLDVLADSVQFVGLDERLSQPAAGSLMCFIVSEKGEEAARQLYARVAGRTVEVGPLLEDLLGDSLDGIEQRWHEYLASEAPVAPSGGL